MNQRQQAVLQHLLNEQVWTIQALAEIEGASPRTIRSDLNVVEAFLNTQAATFTFERQPGKGVCLRVAQKDALVERLKTAVTLTEREERYQFQRLILQLLLAQHPKTLDELAEFSYLSKPALRNELSHIAERLQQNQLTLQIKSKIGVYIEGPEKQKRNALAAIMGTIVQEEPRSVVLADVFDESERERLTALVRSFEKRHQLPHQGQEFNSIVLHLLFMMERLRAQATVSLSANEWRLIEHSKALGYARELTEEIQATFGLLFPHDELGYLALRIASYYIEKQDTADQYQAQIDQQIDWMIDALLEQVLHLMHYDLRQDDLLRQNLHVHLTATFTRIASGFAIANPLKEQIFKNYFQLFFIVQSITQEVAKERDWQIPDEEVAYLTVHLQGAIERLQQHYPVAERRTAIICNFGVGVSAFIEAKMAHVFPHVKVLSLLQESEVQSFLAGEHVDFLLSTVPLSGLPCPIVTISPLFEGADQEVVAQFLVQQPRQETAPTFDMSQLTTPFLVQPQVKVATPADLFDSLVTSVEQKGYVTSAFRTTVLARERKMSTYVGGAIALPHGDPKEVINSFLAIATTEEPLDWQGQSVQVVFLLGLKRDSMEHEDLKAFFRYIHYLVEDSQRLQAIVAAEQPLALIAALSKPVESPPQG